MSAEKVVVAGAGAGRLMAAGRAAMLGALPPPIYGLDRRWLQACAKPEALNCQGT